VEGGEKQVKKALSFVDFAALFLALLTFGVIVAVLAQNFLGIEQNPLSP
jgi:hypothetical protein